MKLKNILKYGFIFLAAGAMLTGCTDGSSDSGSSNPNSTSKPGSTGTPSSELAVTSTKPREIDNFEGNMPDVQPKSGDPVATIEIEGFGTIKAVLFPEAAPIGVENFEKLCAKGFYKGLTIHRVVDQFMFQGGSTNGDGTGGDAAVNGGSFGIETAQNARHYYGALCYANAQGSNSTQFYIVNNKEEQDLNMFNYQAYRDIVAEGTGYLNGAIAEGNIAAANYYLFQTQYYQNTIDWFENATDEIKSLYKQRGGTPSLDGNYTVFGQVYEGFDVIDAISKVEVKDNGHGEVSKPVQDIIIKNIIVTEYK